MRVVRIAAAALVIGLGVASASAAAPAAITASKSLKISLSNDYNDVTQVVGSGTSWLVVGNIDGNTLTDSTLFPSEVGVGGSDGFLTLLDSTLHPVWSHRFGTVNNDVATAIVRDAGGVIWTIGVSSRSSAPTPSPSPSSAPIPTFNPDGVVPVPEAVAPMVADQLLVSSWDSSGRLLSQSLGAIAPGVALNPTSAVVGKNGIYVVGTGVDAVSGDSRGFFVSIGKDGSIGQVRWLGLKAVALRSAIVLSNGTLMVAGSIAEPLKGRPAIGQADALIAVLNSGTGSILRTQRSGDKSAVRSWESLSLDRSGNVLATGLATGRKSETVATCFSATGAVKFTLRLANPVGNPVALKPPTGAFAALAVAANRPGKASIEAFLIPIAPTGRRLNPTYLLGRAEGGLLAAGAGNGYLLASSNAGVLTMAWFAPRSGK